MRTINIQGLSAILRLTFLAFFISFTPMVVAAQGLTLYVSPQGRDTWSGRYPEARANQTDGPFATIERARVGVQALRRQGNSGLITVALRGGTYELPRTLVFGPEDSGTASGPVQYVRYQNEKPVISGGRRITNWTPLADGKWFANVPNIAGKEWVFDQLFVNGQRRQRARTPNAGFFPVADLLDPVGGYWGTTIKRFKFRQGDLRSSWRNLRDAEVVAVYLWMNARLPIDSVDEATQTVGFQKSTRSAYIKFGRYYVDNHFEGLDAPGEWYFDRLTRNVYYIPMPGEDPRTLEITAPLLAELVRFEGRPSQTVQNISLRGLTFTNNLWQLSRTETGDLQAASVVPGALVLKRAESITIAECEMRNLGTYAVEIEGGSYNQIVGNLIHDTGAGGVKITGYDTSNAAVRPLDTRSNTISRNTIRNLGKRHHDGVGVLLMFGSNNTISRNEISDLSYSGISAGYSWGYAETERSRTTFSNVIEYNHIHDIRGDMLNDQAGIYTVGVAPGTQVRNNLIHDISSYGDLGIGIYLDEASSGMNVENNVVVRTKGAGFFLHYGRDNTVVNNIFANGAKVQFGVGRNEPHHSVKIERNIFTWTNAALIGWAWNGKNMTLDRNVYHRTDSATVLFGNMTFAQWQTQGQDRQSLVTNAQLVWTNGIPSVSPTSPAIKLGFVPIDVTRVGPRG